MIPQPITIDGRSGTVVYLDAQWHPVTPERATMARVLFDDGGSAFYTTRDATQKREYVRDEQGQFAEVYHGTAKAHLAKILKEGLKAEYSGRVWPGQSQRGRVYMTTDEDDARIWAQDAADKVNPEHPEEVPIAIITIRIPKEHVDQLTRDEHFTTPGEPQRQFKGDIPPEWIVGAKVGVLSDEDVWDSDYKWKKVKLKKAEGDQIIYVVVVLKDATEGLGGITRKFDAAKHPRGEDGRFIEATQPRIFNRPSDVGRVEGWPGEPERYGWIEEGRVTGRILTGLPLTRESLPETLYHVTTNAPAVESSGVLLGLLESGGLGGGQAQGVSFTSSKEDAVVIQRELRRAIQVARGDAGIEDLEKWARADEQEAGLPEGALNHAVGFAMEGWDGNKFIIDFDYAEGKGWTVPRSPEERERVRRSVLKDALNAYLQTREEAAAKSLGQKEWPYSVPLMKNPILFGQQEHLAKLHPDDVQTLAIPSAQIPAEALVTTGSDTFLHEVRAYSDVPLRRLHSIARKYAPNQPRDPAGTETGGQFTETGRTGTPTSTPELAAQAKAGIAQVEQLLPEAVRTARYEGVSGAWNDLNEAARAAVKEEYVKNEYQYQSQHVDTYELDSDVRKELDTLHKDAFLAEARKRLIEDYGEKVAGLDVMFQAFAGPPPLDTSKMQASHQERTKIQMAWQQHYYDVWKKATVEYQASDAYKIRKEERITRAIEYKWHSLSLENRMDIAYNMRMMGKLQGNIMDIAREPQRWVTGIETGAHGEDNYARTHAIAKKLTELRTDEIRKERGLVGGQKEKPTYTIIEKHQPGYTNFVIKDADGRVIGASDTKEQALINAETWAEEEKNRVVISSKDLITSVWEDWKRNSSSGLSVSLQLAAARELKGHHRLTAEEISEAEYHAKQYGGMETLQAYVRAQWEVTQMVMAKAKQDKIEVYRGLMLAGADVKQSTKMDLVKPSSSSDFQEAKPTNVTTGISQLEQKPYVKFDFAGEHFVVQKTRVLPPISWDTAPPEMQKQVVEAWLDVASTSEHPPARERARVMFDDISDAGKSQIMHDFLVSGQLGQMPYESDEQAMQRRLNQYREGQGRNVFLTKLPLITLQRGGAASTTGTLDVANSWGGIGGNMPPDPERVVLRIAAPPTSVLSLPVYGQNIQEEHESVLLGTKDKWLWDAWWNTAPSFDRYSITGEPKPKGPLGVDWPKPIDYDEQVTHKADRLVIDLQAEDRGKPHWMSTVNWALVQSSAMKFDEAKHPRDPAGTPEGGQFTETGRAGEATSDPALAKLARIGIKEVEELLPKALSQADFGNVPEAKWEDVDSHLQREVRYRWEEQENDEVSGSVDTSYLDKETKQDLQRDNQEVLDEAVEDMLEALSFDDPNPTLIYDPELPLLGLKQTLDPETLDYGDGEEDDNGHIALDLDALRFKDGVLLSDDQKQIVQGEWNKRYRDVFEKHLQKAYDSTSYQEQVNELVYEEVQQRWDNLDDSDKLQLLQDYGFTPKVKNVDAQEPDQWTTGVESGTHTDADYVKTHAIALELTKLRTDEIRKERGLDDIPREKPTYRIETLETPEYAGHTHRAIDIVSNRVIGSGTSEANARLQAERHIEWKMSQPIVNTETLITDVWDEWKQKSSSGLGLALQLAAAREFKGYHRLNEYEVMEAENAAREYGGMDTIQAYVRAQWEVTQMIMAKAKEDKIQVYRGLMLAGAEVNQTRHELYRGDGSLMEPSDITTSDLPNPSVSFRFNGETFVVRRESSSKVRGYTPGVDPSTASTFTRWLAESHELESVETTVQRRIAQYMADSANFMSPGQGTVKLPDLPLKRAGAASTTGTLSVANSWGGVGALPPNPTRVVVRIEAPPTSVLSLPVYGQNLQGEHESVIIGTTDKWLWDAYRHRAPSFVHTPVAERVRKAERVTKPLVIDLQAEDRGKPHWMSSVDWSVVQSSATVTYADVLKYDPNQPREPKGTAEGGQFAQNSHSQAHSVPAQKPHAGAGGHGGDGVPTPAQARPTAAPEATRIAQDYNAQRGLPPIQHAYVTVDEPRARDIARAYEALPVDDSANPAVKEAYQALVTEIQAQWDHITASGVTMTPWTQEGQPYQNSQEMVEDVRTHKRLYFFTGGEPHPFLSEIDPMTKLSFNDMFRAVHDYFGHAAGGYGFGPRGEENAWRAHSQMFSLPARRAMTTETRGQNSWVNFGVHNYNPDGSYKHIPLPDRPYAAQKVAILPDKYVLRTGERR